MGQEKPEGFDTDVERLLVGFLRSLLEEQKGERNVGVSGADPLDFTQPTAADTAAADETLSRLGRMEAVQ